ncbi:hypothetical protein FRC07_006615 [Ceratobasidium sp. 392]|nr:hypothetical protein FRC07_006615 [Ceratobasidium sp. 392]
MFRKLAAAAVFSALFGQVASHGVIMSPTIRQPGPAFRANCGEQIFNNVNSDNAGNIQALEQNKQATTFKADACNLSLCKGLQANQENFNITLPTDLGNKCATAGDCVIQWFWDARSIDQTYESCIDFTISGSGSAPVPVTSNTAAPTTTAAATSTVQPTSTTSANPATTETAEPATTVEPTVKPTTTTTSSAAPIESTAGCGINTQPRVVRRSAKWARCGGFGWTDPSVCPDGMTCFAYNAVSRAET